MSFTFEEGSGFSAYALFNAVKLHFTSDSYNYFKYGGKTNVSKDNFATRKDKYTFYRLSRNYKLDDLRDFYVSNFVVKPVNWIGDIANVEGEENYKKWKKIQESLTYRFKQDIMYLFESSGNCLYVDNGNYPYLLVEMMQGNVCLETVCIMDDIMGFLPMWEKKILDDVVWPEWHKRIESYKPFINYDKEKFKVTLKEVYKEYA
jgi:hypothetical protein